MLIETWINKPTMRYLSVVIILAVIVTAPLAVANAAPSGEQDGSKSGDAPPLSSLQKSLLIPGWGQAAEKHYLEAVFFFSAEVFCWAGFFDQNRRGDQAYQSYRSADNREDAVLYRQRTEVFDTRRNGLLLAAALVWAANLFDTYRIADGHAEKAERRSLSLRLDCGEDQRFSVALSYRY